MRCSHVIGKPYLNMTSISHKGRMDFECWLLARLLHDSNKVSEIRYARNISLEIFEKHVANFNHAKSNPLTNKDDLLLYLGKPDSIQSVDDTLIIYTYDLYFLPQHVFLCVVGLQSSHVIPWIQKSLPPKEVNALFISDSTLQELEQSIIAYSRIDDGFGSWLLADFQFTFDVKHIYRLSFSYGLLSGIMAVFPKPLDWNGEVYLSPYTKYLKHYVSGKHT